MYEAAGATFHGITKRRIRMHYDLATPFYRLLWGPHLHHGLWEADESPARAQRKLTERLAAKAEIERGADVLDVGCGMGASSIYLARRRGCRVTGLTLSPVQRIWASFSAWLERVSSQVRFVCADVEAVNFRPHSFDVVWSVECTEHLFDKQRFFERAAQWLRPGGKVAICAWLAAEGPRGGAATRDLEQVCRGFLCPSLGTSNDYLAWMRRAGLEPFSFTDLTRQIARTWEICGRRVRGSGVRFMARAAGQDMVRFLDRFDTILHAYRSGAMRYGCFAARSVR